MGGTGSALRPALAISPACHGMFYSRVANVKRPGVNGARHALPAWDVGHGARQGASAVACGVGAWRERGCGPHSSGCDLNLDSATNSP